MLEIVKLICFPESCLAVDIYVLIDFLHSTETQDSGLSFAAWVTSTADPGQAPNASEPE